MSTIEEKFWARVEKVTDGWCWNWKGSKETRGYGHFQGGKAHRYSYEYLKGKIPSDKELDHLCRNTGCVNPDHLEAVTHLENVRRGLSGIHNRIKTHCPHGHPYSGDNLGFDRGQRVCKACRKIQDHNRWIRKTRGN